MFTFPLFFLAALLFGSTRLQEARITPATSTEPLTVDLASPRLSSDFHETRRSLSELLSSVPLSSADHSLLTDYLTFIDLASSTLSTTTFLRHPMMPTSSSHASDTRKDTKDTLDTLSSILTYLHTTPPLFHPYARDSSTLHQIIQSDPWGWDPTSDTSSQLSFFDLQQHEIEIETSESETTSERRKRRDELIVGGGIRVRHNVRLSVTGGTGGTVTGNIPEQQQKRRSTSETQNELAWLDFDYDVVIGPGFDSLINVNSHSDSHHHGFGLEIVRCQSEVMNDVGDHYIDILVHQEGDRGEEEEDEESMALQRIKRWIPGSIIHFKMDSESVVCKRSDTDDLDDDDDDDESQQYDELYGLVMRRQILAKEEGKEATEGGGLYVRFVVQKAGLHDLFLTSDSHVHLDYNPGNLSSSISEILSQSQTDDGSASSDYHDMVRRFEVRKMVNILGLDYNYDSTTGKAAKPITLFEKSVEHHKDWSKGGSYSHETFNGHVELTCTDCYLHFEAKAWLVLEGGVFSGVTKLEVSLYGSLKSALEIQLDATADLDIVSHWELFPSTKLAKIAFSVFAVPVWFDVKFGLDFKSWVHFDGAFHAMYRVSYVADADLGYNLGHGFYKKFEQTPSFPKPDLGTIVQEAQVNMDGELQLIPEFQMVWYSTVPVFARVVSYINLESRLDLKQMKVFVEQFYWGIKLQLGIAALEIAGYDIWDEKGTEFTLISNNICPGCLWGPDSAKPEPREDEQYWYLDLGQGGERRGVTDAFGRVSFGEIDPNWSTEVPRLMPIGYRTVSTQIASDAQLYQSTGLSEDISSVFPSHGYYLCVFAENPTDSLRAFIRPDSWDVTDVSFSKWETNDFPFVGHQCWRLDYSTYHSQVEYLLIEPGHQAVGMYHELYPLIFLETAVLGEYLPVLTLQAKQSLAFVYQNVPVYSGGLVLTSHENFPMNFKVIVTGYDEAGEEVKSVTSVYTEEQTLQEPSVHVKEITISLPKEQDIASFDVFILANAQSNNTLFRIALTGFGLISRTEIFSIDPSDPATTRLWRFQNLMRPYKFATMIQPAVETFSLRFFSGRMTSPRGSEDPGKLLNVVGAKAVVEPYEHFLTKSDDFVMMEIPESLDIVSLSVRILFELISGESQDFVAAGSQDFVFSHTNVGMRIITKIVLNCPYVFTAMSTGAEGVEDWTPIHPRKTFHGPNGVSYYEFSEIDLSEEETFFQIVVDDDDPACVALSEGVISMHEVFSIQDDASSPKQVQARPGEVEYFTVTQLEKANLHVVADPPGVTLKFRRFDPTQTMWDFPAIEEYDAREMSTFDHVGIDGVYGTNHDWVVVGVKSFIGQDLTVSVRRYEDPIVSVTFETVDSDPLTDGFDALVTITNCPFVRFSNMFFYHSDARVRKVLASFDGGLLWAQFYREMDTLIEEKTWRRKSKDLRDQIEFDFTNPCSVKFKFPPLGLGGGGDFHDDQVSLTSLPADVFSFEDGRQVDPTQLSSYAVTGSSLPIPAPGTPTPPCPGSCSGHGNCDLDDVCVCVGTWTGPNCGVLACSLADSVDAICWGNGHCQQEGETLPTCVCDLGFYGQYCEYPSCFGKEGVERCSYQGRCLPSHSCQCKDGFTDDDCSKPFCNFDLEIHYNQGETHDGCANDGTCILHDMQTGEMDCDCLLGWQGRDCAEAVCFGLGALSDEVCSGHGECMGPGVCNCSIGYVSDTCGELDCTGIDCHDHGYCNGDFGIPDCTCDAGYDDTTHCLEAICDGKIGDDACSGPDHGYCDTPGHCACESGWDGTDCESQVCFHLYGNTACGGSHGTCSAADTCTCVAGWTGTECSDADCGECVHGQCTIPFSCECTDPSSWYGPSCDLEVCSASNPCLNHGDCRDGECVCPNGFYGSLCSEPKCGNKRGSARCSGRGECLSDHTCLCDATFFGLECEIPCPHGSFDGVTCYCDELWYGLYCEDPRCYSQTGEDRCNQIGECVAPDTCVCPTGWTGAQCKDPACGLDWGKFGCVRGQGTCLGHFCQCEDEFYGLDCSIPKCNSRTMFEDDCQNGGICIGGKCSCAKGFEGEDCSVPICPGGCGLGTCQPDLTCDCTGTNNYGPRCESPLCDGQEANLGCENGGICLFDHSCECVDELWKGDFCQMPRCPRDCNGHGLCEISTTGGTHTCDCDPGYGGVDCSIVDGAKNTESKNSSVTILSGVLAAVAVSCVIFVVLIGIIMFCVGRSAAARSGGLRKRNMELLLAPADEEAAWENPLDEDAILDKAVDVAFRDEEEV